MLNNQQFEGKWNEIKGGVRNLWGNITDDELEQVKGNIYEVTSIVERKYGETKSEIKAKLDQLMNSFDNDTDKGITPDVSSFERAPETAESSQLKDSDIKTRSPEREAFDKKTFEKSNEGIENPEQHSNYNGANPGRTALRDFEQDRNARH